ncbi:MAG TPA: hypothetical protein VHH88_14275, partial [Verrucomicrobiae bacterium]|nr:hypothetical protein [Verrucomicrobiae bacterium]
RERALDTVTYKSPYHLPLLSPGAQFGALPVAVQNTIRAETGSEHISYVSSNHLSGTWVYDIHFVNDEAFPPLCIATNGAVLRPDFSVAIPPAPELITAATEGPITLNDLPEEVLESLRTEAVGGEITSIEKEKWGNRLIYIFTFENPTQFPKLYIAMDGTVLKESHR